MVLRVLLGKAALNNKCGTAYRNYLKVSDALRNTDLQQPHIYFDVQRYTSTHRYGH